MEHGPEMHGLLLGGVLIAAVIGGLVYLAWGRFVNHRKRSDQRASDQGEKG